jgi:hypothetical protein
MDQSIVGIINMNKLMLQSPHMKCHQKNFVHKFIPPHSMSFMYDYVCVYTYVSMHIHLSMYIYVSMYV